MLKRESILTIEGGFCCDIALLFYGTALKFIRALIFLVAINARDVKRASVNRCLNLKAMIDFASR